MNRVSSILILSISLVGCKETEVTKETHYIYLNAESEATCAYSSCGEPIEPEIAPVEPPEEPIEETEPDAPIDIPDPVTLPEFGLNGLVKIDDGEFIVIQGGNISMSYESGFEYMQDFELPEWKVTYRYEPMIEVLITNGSETLCARYSWKKGGFGYAKPYCLWSDTRQAVPLEDMQAAYYGYSIVETRVWVNGVIGLMVEIK